MIVSQGGRYAFAEAAQNLKELAGQEISAQHVMRLTERVGQEWEALRDREIEAFKQDRLARTYTEAPVASAVMLDGGRIQVREESSGAGVSNPEWNEPKYGCFLTLSTKTTAVDPQPEPPSKLLDRERVSKLVQEIQCVRSVSKTRSNTSKEKTSAKRKKRKKTKRATCGLVRTVIASMAGVDEFGYQVAVEVYKRGLDLAQQKACVCDGQASNWTVWREHLKDRGFLPILDFLHLLTYLYAAAQASGGKEQECWDRYIQWLRWAWQGQREKLLVALNAACKRVGPPPQNASESDPRSVLETARTYVTNNCDKMDYPRYRKLGLPISSAPIESTIKQFNKRVKGTEKFWRPSAADAVLQVRAAQLCQDGREGRLWATPRPYRAARFKPITLAA
jgi:hypothetical protein